MPISCNRTSVNNHPFERTTVEEQGEGCIVYQDACPECKMKVLVHYQCGIFIKREIQKYPNGMVPLLKNRLEKYYKWRNS